MYDCFTAVEISSHVYLLVTVICGVTVTPGSVIMYHDQLATCPLFLSVEPSVLSMHCMVHAEGVWLVKECNEGV